jgi:hypothetical protein
MTKFQVVHVKLSKVHERRAKWMAKILFRCLRILTDVMRTFLSYHGLMNSTSIKVQDSQGFLYAIKNRVHLSNFLNANGKTKTQIKRIILNAMKGRNATCHTNLPEILSNWKQFLESWIELCFLMGSNKKAGKIKRLLRSRRTIPGGYLLYSNPTSLRSPPFGSWKKIPSSPACGQPSKKSRTFFLGISFMTS